jgi:hypothetical protein
MGRYDNLWQAIRDYKMDKKERNLFAEMFETLIDPNSNSLYEDMSDNEIESHKFTFENAWIMAKLSIPVENDFQI